MLWAEEVTSGKQLWYKSSLKYFPCFSVSRSRTDFHEESKFEAYDIGI